MNQFDPAHLSPIPKTPVACSLPYELTWDDLQGILPGIEIRQGANKQAFSSYDKQGLNGGFTSCILTLHYLGRNNLTLSRTIFVKLIADPRKVEAQKYKALASLGIPTPSLLSSIHKQGSEIIILEFLPRIGIDFHSTNEVKSLLHLMAQVNSIQNPSDLFNPPASENMQAEFDERVWIALLTMMQDQSIPKGIEISAWFNAYKTAQSLCKSMPQTVNHNEFYFQQVGWAHRNGINQLIIFDLETMWLSHRFTDIAGILPRLAMYTGQHQLELFNIYFDKLCELNVFELEIDEAFHEMKLVQIKDAFHSLPWFIDVAKKPVLNQMLDNPLALAVNSLKDNLVVLGL